VTFCIKVINRNVWLLFLSSLTVRCGAQVWGHFILKSVLPKLTLPLSWNCTEYWLIQLNFLKIIKKYGSIWSNVLFTFYKRYFIEKLIIKPFICCYIARMIMEIWIININVWYIMNPGFWANFCMNWWSWLWSVLVLSISCEKLIQLL